MKSNLANIFRIQKFLQEIKYPDYHRISREISEYLKKKRHISESNIFERLFKQEPWEYISGYVQFCGIQFKVTKDTLIPRIETEQMVYQSVDLIKKKKIKNIIDVGTGSGCIAISIASLLKDISPYSIYATDISRKVLKIAQINEENILKKKHIKWVKNDLICDITPLKGNTLIVANLPYIPTEMYTKLNKSVLDYEPRLALDGGETGLELYKRLFEQIKGKKISVTAIYLETETSIIEDTHKLAKKYYPKKKISAIQDSFERSRFILIQ